MKRPLRAAAAATMLLHASTGVALEASNVENAINTTLADNRSGAITSASLRSILLLINQTGLHLNSDGSIAFPGGPAVGTYVNGALALAPKSITAPRFGNIATRILIGSNPDGQQGWTDAKTRNPTSLLVDVGGYGDPTFSGFAIPTSISGAISVPANAADIYHATGTAGYARTASIPVGGVGLYGQGDAAAPGVTAWGFNTRTQDNGFHTDGLWGGEIDVNIDAAGTLVRGLDIVGGSNAQPSLASPGLIVQSPGVFKKGSATPIFWGRGVLVDDESALTGIEVGTSRVHANTGSMPITFKYRDGANARLESFRLYAPDASGAIEISRPNGLFQIRGDIDGTKVNTLRVVGGNVGLGVGAPSAPSYPLDVFGAARFSGKVGFGGEAPSERCSLPAAVPADGSASNATRDALINAVRACLITKGLAQ
ncbi:hypothetical protein [Methylobacterium dankookense]|uniref:Uncharacterized protein n=1 Tax=Methylobacterium dankookense TaxID=560405 RepID=A0A564G7X4_9HYPH|nr:hypothetical protein [Methylobacterium dankookense]GJD59626.1 hypothetical protein IFDJLNFL_5555 [Methylobacterium dankookense]VUF16084.1 hypothetical protein MTDSW087_05835 [Methylobacterium dankookense]